MGGGTSSFSGRIPIEAEAELPVEEGALTRQMLDSLARKNFSPGKRRQSSSRLFRAATNIALPMSVTKLLEKIGVQESNNDASFTEHKSKLVAHIFECLAALQTIVNAADLTGPDEEIETQSVVDRDEKAMGALLHEMVSIYGLCGDTISTLLAASPAAATFEDNIGRLPLHVAVDSDSPWLRTIKSLLKAYPRACRERDGAGRVPLHIAVDRNNPCIDTLHLLLSCYPEAAAIRRGVGRLAIHYAAFAESQSVEVMACLLNAYPQGAKEVDLYGRLPLHYAVDHYNCSKDAVLYLLKVYPESASIPDKSGKYPLTLALERGHRVEIIRILFETYPDIDFNTSNFKKSLLHVYLERIMIPQLDIVRYIISIDILQSRRRGSDKSSNDLIDILELCRLRKLNEIEREILIRFSCSNPEDRKRLGQLNWESRRIAMLACKASCNIQSDNTTQRSTSREYIIARLFAHCTPAFEKCISFL